MKQPIIMQKASREDVADIVRLFVGDILGATREYTQATLPESYYAAFEAINRDENQFLMIATLLGKTVGTLQLSYLWNMSFQGAKRAIIEGVHVDSTCRNQGIGQQMIAWAVRDAREKGCRFVQLTSNKQRLDAHRFYARLGFTASHEGFKLDLAESTY